MAKRKATTRKVARRKAVTTRRTVGRTASGGKKSAATAKKKSKVVAKKSARKTASAPKKAKKTVAKAKAVARPIKGLVKRAAPVIGRIAKVAAPIAKSAKKAPTAKKAAPPRKKTAAKARAVVLPQRTAPGLDRERRVIRDDDDIVPSPPSSLDFDRSASAARSGRRELRERFDQHTETSPALTGGDVDADWESAYSVGDEAPGGDNPTPDQDLVDDIGRAVGVEYQDNEELKGEEKIAKRDRDRWELDPASSDDWDDR